MRICDECGEPITPVEPRPKSEKHPLYYCKKCNRYKEYIKEQLPLNASSDEPTGKVCDSGSGESADAEPKGEVKSQDFERQVRQLLEWEFRNVNLDIDKIVKRIMIRARDTGLVTLKQKGGLKMSGVCDCGNDEFVPMSMTDYPVMKCTKCDYSYQDHDITFEEYAEYFKPNRPKDWKVELVNGKWVDNRPEKSPEIDVRKCPKCNGLTTSKTKDGKTRYCLPCNFSWHIDDPDVTVMDKHEVKAFVTTTRLRNVLGELVIEYQADEITILEIVHKNLSYIISKVEGQADVALNGLQCPKCEATDGFLEIETDKIFCNHCKWSGDIGDFMGLSQ